MSSYKSYLAGAVERIQRDFGDYVPSQFPMHLLSRLDDETAYETVKVWRDAATNNYRAAGENGKTAAKSEGPETERLHLKFEFTPDGYRVINTRTGGIETVYSIGNGGGFSYDGRRKDAYLIGGRSEIGGIPQVTKQIYENLHDHDLRR